MEMYHTQVHPQFQGRQYGRRLVDAAVIYSRKQNLNIIATCSYVKRVL
jgi:predicted GNAT family acetyltransferase